MATYRSAIAEIKKLDKQANGSEEEAKQAQQEAERLHWLEAEEIFNLVTGITTGTKQSKSQVARDAGIDRTKCTRYFKAWERFGQDRPADERIPFADALADAHGDNWGNTPREKIFEDRIKKEPERAARQALQHVTPAVRQKIIQEEHEKIHVEKIPLEPRQPAIPIADRKASEAWAADQPIVRAAHGMVQSVAVVGCIGSLEEAVEHLRDAMKEGQLNNEAIDKIHRAHDTFAVTLREAEFMVEERS